MCFRVLAEKCKGIKRWIRVKIAKKKIAPEGNPFAQILAGKRRVPDGVLITKEWDPILGKFKSKKTVQ